MPIAIFRPNVGRSARCVHCKAEETELCENGAPICLGCAELRSGSVHAALVHAPAEDALQADSGCMEFTAICGDIPSDIPHPDGVQRIHNTSRKLTAASEAMMGA